MQSHEAIQTAIGGKTVEHAKALHLSSSAVHKWQEPSTDFTDSGSLNPLDRVETIIQTSLNLDSSIDKAIAPVQYLAERFGLIVLSLPKIPDCHEQLTADLLKMIAEFGDLTRETGLALAQQRMTKKEARQIDEDCWILIRQIAVFLHHVAEAAK